MMNNSFEDTAGLALADALGVGSLRYPGGTMSNVWDMMSGRYVTPPGGWDYQGSTYHRFEPFGKWLDAEPAEKFSAAAFMRGAGRVPKTIVWDVNVFSLNLSRTCAQFELIGELQPQGELLIELGNEFYDAGQMKPVFADGHAYVAAMAPIVACARKALGRRAKIAACGTAPGKNAWLAALKDNLGLFDAISHHDYSGEPPASLPAGEALSYVLGYSRAELRADVQQAARRWNLLLPSLHTSCSHLHGHLPHTAGENRPQCEPADLAD